MAEYFFSVSGRQCGSYLGLEKAVGESKVKFRKRRLFYILKAFLEEKSWEYLLLAVSVDFDDYVYFSGGTFITGL